MARKRQLSVELDRLNAEKFESINRSWSVGPGKAAIITTVVGIGVFLGWLFWVVDIKPNDEFKSPVVEDGK